MRAAVVLQYGNDEDWRDCIEVQAGRALPEPGAGEVLVRISHASINPGDYHAMLGHLSLMLDEPPYVPGIDFSGTVARLGPECDSERLAENMAVFGSTRALPKKGSNDYMGTFAEYAVVSQDTCIEKPENVSFAEAAAMPVTGMAAYEALVNSGKLEEGQRVLILGGSGGCGSAAIQIAKARGAAFVACTCSAQNADFIRELGADLAIDYSNATWWEGLEEEAGGKFDLVVDTVGGTEYWEAGKKVLKGGGKYASLAGMAGDQMSKVGVKRILQTFGQVLNRKFWSLFGYPGYIFVVSEETREKLEAIAELMAAGALAPRIDRTVPLDNIHDAFEASLSRRVRGKISVSVAPV